MRLTIASRPYCQGVLPGSSASLWVSSNRADFRPLAHHVFALHWTSCRVVAGWWLGGDETRPGWDGPKRRQGFGAESSLECLQMWCVPPMEQVAKLG